MNRRTATQSASPGIVPGNSVQQMWHVLNFHERRLQQIAELYQKMESKQLAMMGAQQQTIARLAQVVKGMEKKVKTLETDLMSVRAANAALTKMSITVEESDDDEEESAEG